MKKWRKSEVASEHEGLFRIEATRDIPRHYVKRGQLGGYLADESCLDQEGDCWVGSGCCVKRGGRVSGNALITGVVAVESGEVTDNAVVSGNVLLWAGQPRVAGEAKIVAPPKSSRLTLTGNVTVDEYAKVVCAEDGVQIVDICFDAHLTGNTYVEAHCSATIGRGTLCGKTVVMATPVEGEEHNMLWLNAKLVQDAFVGGCPVVGLGAELIRCHINGRAKIGENAKVLAGVSVSDSSEIRKDAVLSGDLVVKDSAVVAEGVRIDVYPYEKRRELDGIATAFSKDDARELEDVFVVEQRTYGVKITVDTRANTYVAVVNGVTREGSLDKIYSELITNQTETLGELSFDVQDAVTRCVEATNAFTKNEQL